MKISLLDADVRSICGAASHGSCALLHGRRLPLSELIAGDGKGFSHALLFRPLGPVAAEAVRTLDTGDTAGFHELLDPTVELSRHLFQPPTRFYKTGVVLLAWLAGHQDHFTMVGAFSRHARCRTW